MALTAKDGIKTGPVHLSICTPVITGHGVRGHAVHGYQVQHDLNMVYIGYPIQCDCGVKASKFKKNNLPTDAYIWLALQGMRS